jgi:hypothetical protein
MHHINNNNINLFVCFGFLTDVTLGKEYPCAMMAFGSTSVKKRLPRVTAFWETGPNPKSKDSYLTRICDYIQVGCAMLILIAGAAGVLCQIVSPLTALGGIVYSVSGLSILLTVSKNARRYARRMLLSYLPDGITSVLYEM